MSYKGYAVIVEGYLYKLKVNPYKSYMTFQDIKNVIDGIEESELIKQYKTTNEVHPNRTEGLKT